MANKNNMANIGRQIKKQREALKLSHDHLAGQCGVSRTFISNLENGKAKGLSLNKLEAIAKAVGIKTITLTF